MKRTISAMMGKGSINHNSRKFHAKNTDPTRSDLNIEYCNEDLRDVYHELFDDAVERYNEKQKRSDRRIDDYYEKIRTGKQQKLFYEVVVQIGNKDDSGVLSEEGTLMSKILDDYMHGFAERNPSLRVFSAHLHMDEATPHLHIDFVPVATGCKRGMDTQVSLKKALAELGFEGGTKQATEWNQWISSEKGALAQVMERYGVEWERLGTHEEHLSVLDYKKQERTKEVAALDEKAADLREQNSSYMKENAELQDELDRKGGQLREISKSLKTMEAKEADTTKELEFRQKKLGVLRNDMSLVEQYAGKYLGNPDEWLPKPNTMESAKKFRDRIIPVIWKVTDLIYPLYSKCLEFQRQCSTLSDKVRRLNESINFVSEKNKNLMKENQGLQVEKDNLDRVRTVLGSDVVDQAIETAQQRERAARDARKAVHRSRGRDLER